MGSVQVGAAASGRVPVPGWLLLGLPLCPLCCFFLACCERSAPIPSPLSRPPLLQLIVMDAADYTTPFG